MEGRGNATWAGLLVAGVVVLGAPALATASYYGEGSYFGNEYYGLAGVTTPGGGGTCLNCTSGGGSSGSGSSSTSTTTKPVGTASAGTSGGSSATSTTGGAPTSTPFRCAETAPVSDGLSGPGLVNLLVSLGIIPSGKAKTACEALSSRTASTSMPAAVQVPGSFRFSVPLAKGMRSDEVRRLQVFLNANGFAVATGAEHGAPGHETDLFGLLTEGAVKRFQAAYAAEILVPAGLTAPSGFFGPSSISKANALLGS